MDESYYYAKGNIFFQSDEEVKKYFFENNKRIDLVKRVDFIEYVEEKFSPVEVLCLTDTEKERIFTEYENELVEQWFSNECVKCETYKAE